MCTGCKRFQAISTEFGLMLNISEYIQIWNLMRENISRGEASRHLFWSHYFFRYCCFVIRLYLPLRQSFHSLLFYLLAFLSWLHSSAQAIKCLQPCPRLSLSTEVLLKQLPLMHEEGIRDPLWFWEEWKKHKQRPQKNTASVKMYTEILYMYTLKKINKWRFL